MFLAEAHRRHPDQGIPPDAGANRVTLAMIIGIPLMQLCLFGFAINFNPSPLPAAVSIADPGVYARSIVAAMRNSSYFEIVAETRSPTEARRLLQEGKVLFVLEVPVNFSRDLVKGATPRSVAGSGRPPIRPPSGYAISAFNAIASSTALRRRLERFAEESCPGQGAVQTP